MEDHCFVLCGDWRCCDDGKWDFVIDKQRMSRVIRISLDMKLTEVKDVGVSEFGVSKNPSSMMLSFWPSQGKEDAPTNKTPHVLLTTDVSLCSTGTTTIAEVSHFKTPEVPNKGSGKENFFEKITESFQTEASPSSLRTEGLKIKSKSVYTYDDEMVEGFDAVVANLSGIR
ncbi:unnamed protein product [Arabis nemorensis]|uniref:Uncharacterized protein n=1 Tax=Arabis nemorensis TaxID=586526 RepID=A0A565C4F3_9BRAS|nr:unnamed protein product [Arabis nemorensis]